jgi:hypothetical protein
LYRLTKIIANILRDLYGIKPAASADRIKLARNYNQELENWRSELAYLLNSDGIDPSLLVPLFQRQRNVLNLAFWHAQLLVHRPFLLSSFADLSNFANRNKESASTDYTSHVHRCLDAALNIAKTVDHLHSHGQIYVTHWVSIMQKIAIIC